MMIRPYKQKGALSHWYKKIFSFHIHFGNETKNSLTSQ